jgi:hypothetical protein
MKRQFLTVLFVLALSSQFTFAQVDNISTAGGPISHEQCMTWVKQYENSGGKTPGHMFGSIVLRELLNQPNTAGIVIFTGLDGDGGEHLIFKTLDESGNISNTNFSVNNGMPCPPFCPEEDIAQLGSQIEEGLAQQMIAKFKSTYPDRIYATSFGRTAVEIVLNQKEAAGIYFANGLDKTNNEHLILVGVKENGKIMWENNIVNGGMPCPPFCPEEGYPEIKTATVKN